MYVTIGTGDIVLVISASAVGVSALVVAVATIRRRRNGKRRR